MAATDVELDPHQIRCVCFAWLINRHLMETQDLALRGVRIWADLSRGIIVQGSEQRGLDFGPGPSFGAEKITKPPSQPSVLCRGESRKLMAVAWPIKLRSVVTCEGIIFGLRGPAQPMMNLSLGKAAGGAVQVLGFR